MACKGNATEYCGGSNRLNVYQFGIVTTTTPVVSSTSSSISSSSSSTATTTTGSSTTSKSSTSSSTSSSATGGATGLPSGWTYRGCYVDNANGGRILQNVQPASSTMTVDKCVTACINAGYQVSGLEYGTGMYCLSNIRPPCSHGD